MHASLGLSVLGDKGFPFLTNFSGNGFAFSACVQAKVASWGEWLALKAIMAVLPFNPSARLRIISNRSITI